MASDQPPVAVVVRLRRDIAPAFRGGSAAASASADVQAVLTSFGAKLEAMHPGISDAELGSYFTVSGLSPTQAEQLAALLRALSTVEAAYMQPPASPA